MMSKKILYVFIFFVSLCLFSCGGNDEIEENGEVTKINGSVTVKSYETDANGTITGVQSFPNRDGINLKLYMANSDGGYVSADTAFTENGAYTLTAERLGTYRIVAKVNDLIKTEVDTIVESKGNLSLSPIRFGPYTELSYGEYLTCQLPRPNPVSTLPTTIAYTTYATGDVSAKIYDTKGKLVRRLISSEFKDASSHTIIWDGRNDDEIEVPADVYFFTLEWTKENDSTKYRFYISTIIKEN